MADFNKNNFDPKAAAEARKAEMNEITAKLEKGVQDIFKSENYKDYLNFCAKLPRYSVNNQILIMMQKPEATMCQSFSGWKEMNRIVKRGEKGIRILAPSPYKMQKEQDKKDSFGKPVLDTDGEPVKETVEVTVNAFKPVSTFDVSQTEGDPIPTVGVNELVGSVNGYETLLAAIKDAVPVPISFEQIESGAKGYFSLDENKIVVQEGMSEAQTVKTLLHEASHQSLHSREAFDKNKENKTKNQKETEAESVAYVVCQHYGIDTSDYSFAYVATWSADKDVPELKASLDTIRRAASDLIVKIDEKIQTLTEVKAVDEFSKIGEEELPFVNPEADQPEGFINIEPPVDFKDEQRDKKYESQKEQDEKKDAPSKEAKEKISAKKESVINKLSKVKEKSEKTKSPKKMTDRDVRPAI